MILSSIQYNFHLAINLSSPSKGKLSKLTFLGLILYFLLSNARSIKLSFNIYALLLVKLSIDSSVNNLCLY